jgi:hypothetical protein
MKRFLIGAGSLLLLAALPAGAQGSRPHDPIPKTLTLSHATLPIWIDASVALTNKGEPNPAVWGDDTARIREILSTPSDHPIYRDGKIAGYQDRSSTEGCRPVGATYIDYPDPPRRGTIDEAVADSKVALLARITGRAYGFYGGDPGQLFQIEPLHAYGSGLSKAAYYFFVPVGQFRVGKLEICKTDERYSAPPEIGDEVFLFVGKPADGSGVLFHVLNPGDVVPVDPSGSLRLPRQYTADQGQALKERSALSTKSDLLAKLQAVRGKGAQP